MARINKNLEPKPVGRVWNAPRKQNLFFIGEIRVIRGSHFGFRVEWVQNRQEFYWAEARVDAELQQIITTAYRDVFALSQQRQTTLRGAAYQMAIERMVAASTCRGVQQASVVGFCSL